MEKEIKWSSPEFDYYEKSVLWYWGLLIITVVLVAIALWQKNFLFAVFIIVAAVLTGSWSRKTPRTIDFTLSDKGLDIGNERLHRYDQLSGFSIIPHSQNEDLRELVLKTKNIAGGFMKIIISAEQIEPIKHLLSGHIPEIEYQESLSDRISRALKF